MFDGEVDGKCRRVFRVLENLRQERDVGCWRICGAHVREMSPWITLDVEGRIGGSVGLCSTASV